MPLGSATVVMICRVVIEIVTMVVALCCGVPESVTLNVNGVAARADVGVPLIAPVEAFNFKPAGSVPEVNCQVYGVTPPLAVRVVEQAVVATQLRETAGAVTSWGMIVSAKVAEAVCCGVPESVTLNVSDVAVTGDVGVPLISPVEVFSVSPVGNVPTVNCQVSGAVPPVAATLCEYGVPTMPLGSATVVIICRAAIEIVTVVVAVCCGTPESVTLNVNGVAVSAAVGVPLMAPVEVFSVKPAGSVPEVNCQVYGLIPPVAVSVVEHEAPTMQLRVSVGAVSRPMIVRVRDTDAVCGIALESVTLKVSGVAVTAEAGVPLMAPVAVLSVNPAGSVPAVNVQVYGVVPPNAARACV